MKAFGALDPGSNPGRAIDFPGQVQVVSGYAGVVKRVRLRT